MRFTEDHQACRKVVRDVVEREIAPHVDDRERAGASPAHELSPSWARSGCSGSSTTRCLQFHGDVGYVEGTWTSRFLRDSRLLSVGGGADEVMLQVLAKLDGFDP